MQAVKRAGSRSMRSVPHSVIIVRAEYGRCKEYDKHMELPAVARQSNGTKSSVQHCTVGQREQASRLLCADMLTTPCIFCQEST
jgi:hypothetical protein